MGILKQSKLQSFKDYAKFYDDEEAKLYKSLKEKYKGL